MSAVCRGFRDFQARMHYREKTVCRENPAPMESPEELDQMDQGESPESEDAKEEKDCQDYSASRD